MRIAFVTVEYPPNLIGGAGLYAKGLANGLAETNEIFVFTPSTGLEQVVEQGQKPAIVPVQLPFPKLFPALQFWLLLPKYIKRYESEKKFDIIHINGVAYWFLKRKLSNAPIVMTMHHLVKDAVRGNNLSRLERIKRFGSENGPLIPLIESRCVSCADLILANSGYTRKRVIEEYELEERKVHVVYQAIDVDDSQVDEVKMRIIRDKYDLHEKKVVLFAGRVDDPRKGLDVLLSAIGDTKERTDYVVVIAGSGRQEHAMEIARSLGIEGRIRFTGFVDESTLYNLFALCDVHVCPSRLEGFGRTILEALHFNKQVVASNVGAISEIADERVCLVPPEDHVELGKAILSAIDGQNGKGETAPPNVRDRFSWKSATDQTNAMYSWIRTSWSSQLR
jgi:glycosyltransferase involved in cell wall biosynthesis